MTFQVFLRIMHAIHMKSLAQHEESSLCDIIASCVNYIHSRGIKKFEYMCKDAYLRKILFYFKTITTIENIKIIMENFNP